MLPKIFHLLNEIVVTIKMAFIYDIVKFDIAKHERKCFGDMKLHSHPASMLATETLEKGTKYVQS